MEFKKYQHIERLGTTEVINIEIGKCFVFPKIDGSNASIWMNGTLQAGSRKRHLTLDSDNAGFYAWALEKHGLADYFAEYPTHRLFGEWLVPHALKTYREDAWRRFYVFDVCTDKEDAEITHENDSTMNYIAYDEYTPGLEAFGLDYILPICSIENASHDQLVAQLMKNVFLIEDGKGIGEGIVLKNYEFYNKYNRQTWAKIVTSEFKDKHTKEHGVAELKGKKIIEMVIANEFVSKAMCDKIYSKIENEDGFNSRMIPRLLNTIYYDLVREETWEFVKKHKSPTIDFKKLQQFTFLRIKELMPELF